MSTDKCWMAIESGPYLDIHCRASDADDLWDTGGGDDDEHYEASILCLWRRIERATALP